MVSNLIFKIHTRIPLQGIQYGFFRSPATRLGHNYIAQIIKVDISLPKHEMVISSNRVSLYRYCTIYIYNIMYIQRVLLVKPTIIKVRVVPLAPSFNSCCLNLLFQTELVIFYGLVNNRINMSTMCTQSENGISDAQIVDSLIEYNTRLLLYVNVQSMNDLFIIWFSFDKSILME